MTDLNTAPAPRRRRRQYAKGLTTALDTLVTLAGQLHQQQVGTAAEANGTRSTDVLAKAFEIYTQTYGETPEAAGLMSTLADYHADFGEHGRTSELLESIIEYRRLTGDDIGQADALRRVASSYSTQGRVDEALVSRREARMILVEHLNSPALSVFESLVNDEAALAGDCQKAPEAADLAVEVTEPKRGEVYWAKLPQFPNDPHQPRPVVVVSPTRHNSRSSSIHVAPIYSRSSGHRCNLPVPFKSGGLNDGSVIQCNRLCSIEKSLLRGNLIGTLSQEVVDEVLRIGVDALNPRNYEGS